MYHRMRSTSTATKSSLRAHRTHSDRAHDLDSMQAHRTPSAFSELTGLKPATSNPCTCGGPTQPNLSNSKAIKLARKSWTTADNITFVLLSGMFKRWNQLRYLGKQTSVGWRSNLGCSNGVPSSMHNPLSEDPIYHFALFPRCM